MSCVSALASVCCEELVVSLLLELTIPIGQMKAKIRTLRHDVSLMLSCEVSTASCGCFRRFVSMIIDFAKFTRPCFTIP